MKNCLECGSEKIISNVKVLDRASQHSSLDFRVAVDANPEAYIFKERNYSKVTANVCGACGFIHFFAEDYKMLWNSYKNQKKTDRKTIAK
jgi:formate dehydrogenase assembly factor FdhD